MSWTGFVDHVVDQVYERKYAVLRKPDKKEETLCQEKLCVWE